MSYMAWVQFCVLSSSLWDPDWRTALIWDIARTTPGLTFIHQNEPQDQAWHRWGQESVVSTEKAASVMSDQRSTTQVQSLGQEDPLEK